MSLLVETKLEIFTNIFSEGCFYCGTKSQEVQAVVDYEFDHCIDICE